MLIPNRHKRCRCHPQLRQEIPVVWLQTAGIFGYIITVSVHFVKSQCCPDSALKSSTASTGPFVNPVWCMFFLYSRNHLFIFVHGFSRILHSVRRKSDGLKGIELIRYPVVCIVIEIRAGIRIDMLSQIINIIQGSFQKLACPVEITEKWYRKLCLKWFAIMSVLAALFWH